VDQNKENQRILAQATVEANDKIEQLEKQTAQLYAALMAKQPQQIPYKTQLQQQSKHQLTKSIDLKVEKVEKKTTEKPVDTEL